MGRSRFLTLIVMLSFTTLWDNESTIIEWALMTNTVVSPSVMV